MTTRLLPPEEWDRLVGTEADAVRPYLATLGARPLVVEDETRIVGCWVLLPMWHAECLWIAPSHRTKASVGRRLLRGLWTAAAAMGIERIWTSAGSDDVRQLLTRYGAQAMPGDHFVMGMK